MEPSLMKMRQHILVLVPCLFFGVFSHAQSAGIGLKGGLLASTTKSLNIRTAPIPGITAGLYFPWGIGPGLELQPEVTLGTLGASYSEPDGDQYTVRSLYLQVPVTFKYFLNNRFNLALGYQFSKLLLAQEQGTEGNATVTSAYENLDMGFVGGIGFDTDHGLDLSIRGYGAMTPSLRNDDAIFPKNRSVQVTIGYRFVQFRAGTRSAKRG